MSSAPDKIGHSKGTAGEPERARRRVEISDPAPLSGATPAIDAELPDLEAAAERIERARAWPSTLPGTLARCCHNQQRARWILEAAIAKAAQRTQRALIGAVKRGAFAGDDRLVHLLTAERLDLEELAGSWIPRKCRGYDYAAELAELGSRAA
jgi:hypothetical protein